MVQVVLSPSRLSLDMMGLLQRGLFHDITFEAALDDFVTIHQLCVVGAAA